MGLLDASLVQRFPGLFEAVLLHAGLQGIVQLQRVNNRPCYSLGGAPDVGHVGVNGSVGGSLSDVACLTPAAQNHASSAGGCSAERQ